MVMLFYNLVLSSLSEVLFADFSGGVDIESSAEFRGVLFGAAHVNLVLNILAPIDDAIIVSIELLVDVINDCHARIIILHLTNKLS